MTDTAADSGRARVRPTTGTTATRPSATTTCSWFQDEPGHEPGADLAGRPTSAPASSTSAVARAGSSTACSSAGYRDLTVVDLSQQALTLGHASAWAMHPSRGSPPTSATGSPVRTFDVWHDRAAYHFLTDPDDQQHYWHLVRDSGAAGRARRDRDLRRRTAPRCAPGLPVARYGADELAAAMGEGFAVLDARARAARDAHGRHAVLPVAARPAHLTHPFVPESGTNRRSDPPEPDSSSISPGQASAPWLMTITESAAARDTTGPSAD